MDYYEPRDDLDEPPFQQMEQTPIQKLYEGAHIFITGGSGFMGKILIEKILRTCNVGQMYLLMRDKQGVKSEDRLESLFNDMLFEPLKLQKPGEVKKVCIITGDCSMPGLGLSDHNKMLMSRINIIFHAAATLAVDQHLKLAYATNVLATKTLLEFAKTLPNLQAFMYVSTAYTHAYRDRVDESFYDVSFEEDQVNQLCEQLNDKQIGALTPKLTGRWGNSYAFTKACAENLVLKYDQVIPVGVVRPSIVVSVWREPLVGWINNVYGAIGVVTGTALGLLRVWYGDRNTIGDMIPVDIAINMALAASWEVAVKNTHVKIYNLVSSSKNPITWNILQTASVTHSINERIDTVKSIAVCDFCLVKNQTLYFFYFMWYHVIPAYFIDLYLKYKKKTISLMRVYIKVYNLNKTLHPYCERDIVFTSNHVDELWESLHPADKKRFDYDLNGNFCWTSYWLNALKGLRVYLLKDPMDTIPRGIKHSQKLRRRKIIFDSLVWMILTTAGYYFARNVLSIYLKIN